jgi:hypothetical protein
MSPNIQIHLFNLVAFIAVIVSIVVLALAGDGKTDLAIMTGLVGVLGSFKPWGSAPPQEEQKKAPDSAKEAAEEVAGAAEERRDEIIEENKP